MAKSKWVKVEWNGPQYSTMVQGGQPLFAERKEWTYGLHVRGDVFVVLRADAENDARFVILENAKSPYEPEDDEEEGVVAHPNEQPPENPQAEEEPSPVKTKKK